MAKTDDVLTRFGEKLREVRTQKGVSQERLSELAGLHRTYISLIERGERNLTLRTVQKIADALEVELIDIIPRNEA